jgi:hypothetical protein
MKVSELRPEQLDQTIIARMMPAGSVGPGFSPSTSIADAYLMEGVIAKDKDFIPWYGAALIELLGPGTVGWDDEIAYLYAHAPPLIRARAALIAAVEQDTECGFTHFDTDFSDFDLED